VPVFSGSAENSTGAGYRSAFSVNAEETLQRNAQL
jgi:hypothetical protein